MPPEPHDRPPRRAGPRHLPQIVLRWLLAFAAAHLVIVLAILLGDDGSGRPGPLGEPDIVALAMIHLTLAQYTLPPVAVISWFALRRPGWSWWRCALAGALTFAAAKPAFSCRWATSPPRISSMWTCSGHI